VHLVGFHYKEYIKMHGQQNIKFEEPGGMGSVTVCAFEELK
jgi:hypothetical protein